jgi:glycolate oxidase FAD binding subunit
MDWVGGQRWYRGDAPLADMEKLARSAGGQVSLFRGGDRRGEVMQSPPEALKTIQRRVKNSFDPDGLFNPGRLYSWL